MNPPVRLSQRAARAVEQPISFLMREAVTNPDLISLAAGLVDHASLPADETLSTLGELLTDPAEARQALQYGTTQGLRELRELVVHHIAALDGTAGKLRLDPDHVVITTGSQQLLELVSDVLLDPDDIALVGAPDYFVYLGVLSRLGARIMSVAMDEDGLIPESLAEMLAFLDRSGELGRVKLVYCTSYYQNPTGVTLAAERRQAILEIVEKWSTDSHIFVLEDAAYREIYYQRPGPNSIRAHDRAGQTVILAQTFSKAFAPGLKLGYSVVPPELIGPVLDLKGSHDFGSANFNQHLLAALMRSGRYQEHVDKLRSVYRLKLAATLDALQAEFGRRGITAHWTRPDGGLYVWVTLPDVDTTRSGELFRRSLENGVLYVPGEYCFAGQSDQAQVGALGGPHDTLRLSFGVQPVERIREGIARLAAAVPQ